jgi:predicted tellurium resistance membrane protein TerC
MEILLSGEIWAALLSLTALEIVLGIDNLVFLSVTVARLPVHQRAAAQRIGLVLALGMRIVLLASAVWLAGLTEPLFEVLGHTVSWRDGIMLGGGLFLLAKGTAEIHETVEGEHEAKASGKGASFALIIGQIVALDLVFSIDSVITAIGMTHVFGVMVAAVTIAIGVMMFAATPVSQFIHAHPTAKMLALSFLLLIGVALIADGLHFHIPRGYLYFAIAFSISVEALNLWAKARKKRRETAGAGG